jgi:hypothetical protein
VARAFQSVTLERDLPAVLAAQPVDEGGRRSHYADTLDALAQERAGDGVRRLARGRRRLRILTIADLIQYRLQTERLVRRVSEKKLILDETRTEWSSYVYESATDNRQFIALVKGEIRGDEATLCRMH